MEAKTARDNAFHKLGDLIADVSEALDDASVRQTSVSDRLSELQELIDEERRKWQDKLTAEAGALNEAADIMATK